MILLKKTIIPKVATRGRYFLAPFSSPIVSRPIDKTPSKNASPKFCIPRGTSCIERVAIEAQMTAIKATKPK